MVCAISLKGSCQLAQVILNAARKYLPEHACSPFCTCSRISKWVLHRLNYPPTQADYLSFFNEQTEKAILSPTDCPSLDLPLNNISSSNETTVIFKISRDFWITINIVSSSSSGTSSTNCLSSVPLPHQRTISKRNPYFGIVQKNCFTCNMGKMGKRKYRFYLFCKQRS